MASLKDLRQFELRIAAGAVKLDSDRERTASNDQSRNETVVEYGVQEMLKRKSPRAAARQTARKLGGGDNLFLGENVVIDAEVLEEELWGRIVKYAVKGATMFKEGTEHFALDGALQYFKQKDSLRPKLKKRVIEAMGKNPFTHDDRERTSSKLSKRKIDGIVSDLNAGWYGEWKVEEVRGREVVVSHPVSGSITTVNIPECIRFVGGKYRPR